MSKLTPQQVLKQIAADLKLYGISYEDAAKLLGYTNKQTVANILYSKKYLAPEQAKRFHDAFFGIFFNRGNIYRYSCESYRKF